MSKRFLGVGACIAFLLAVTGRAALLSSGQAGDFPLVADRSAAPFVIETDCDRAVARAADDLRTDIADVSGPQPALRHQLSGEDRAVVVVGVVGRSSLLRSLATAGKIDLSALNGAWESYVIAVVPEPFPGVRSALVIAGSDRRGAIYGCYELSEAIGVSPWHWWADVPSEHHDDLYIAAGRQHFGPPAVKYRGLFINDEDWGLQPWARHTFEPERANIGPKTYARVFELLLRLKANTLWPAMHACSTPFNAIADNARLADGYGIVMGSSHAEPMLRNNVGEWKDAPERYNYVTNAEGVRAYWEQRIRENGGYENIYTLGMRGIHDSGMQGARTDAERIRVLEDVFAAQRELLRRHVSPDVERIPQMFCAYKEVLDLYRGGLRVPDDVTIVWPDDNFGYIRNYPTAAELRRRGGFGVYYHLSYLGAPLSYLWLCTTPPGLIWEEMSKAYQLGARTLWIANVGDLKPAEIGTEFFFRLAWSADSTVSDDVPRFLRTWATREFGAAAPEIAGILDEHFRLNYQRKPEHLQWWRPGEPPHASPFSDQEIRSRLAAFAALRTRVTQLQPRISPDRQDAFFELVAYPVLGAALANERYFCGEMAATTGATPETWLVRAQEADREITRLTDRYQNGIAGGKWRRLMSTEPADDQWHIFRLDRWCPPTYLRTAVAARAADEPAAIAREAEHFDQKVDRAAARWQVVPVGRTGSGGVTVFPCTAPTIPAEQLREKAPRLDYVVSLGAARDLRLVVNLVPTQPIQAGRGLRFGVSLDDDPPREIVVNVRDGSPEWEQSVLNATIETAIPLSIPAPGKHVVHLFGEDAGVVIDKLAVVSGSAPPSYLGPTETSP